MATIYVQPGSGSGSGTASDPYYYDDEFATAYSAAGSGGIIYLTDGTYQVGRLGSTGINFYNVDYGDATIIALNKHKAIMECYATIGYFKNARLKNIKLKEQAIGTQQSYMCYSADSSHYLEMTGCVVEFLNKSLQSYFVQTAGIRLRGCTFWFKTIGGCFNNGGGPGSIIENCTFRIDGDDSGLSSTYNQMFKHFDLCFYDPDNFTVRNNIFSFGYTANANLASYGFIRSGYGGGTFQNNCFHQDASSASTMPMSSLDNATINAGNIDLDPEFLDIPTANFGLRATSPCLSAGYLE